MSNAHRGTVETESARDKAISNVDNSDRENDMFEDVNDLAATETAQNVPIERSRSLTKRQPSSMKSSLHTSGQPPVPAVPDLEINGGETNGHMVHTELDSTPPQSPLLTPRRLSTTSLDNVSLEEDETDVKPNPSIAQGVSNPALPRRTTKPSLQGLSGILPSVPWAPPPAASFPAQTPPLPARKSPFSWLSRNTSAAPKEPIISPPLVSPERRNTASSIATAASNPEMMSSKLEENHESDGGSGKRRPIRSSLKDRFKLLRMREEAGVAPLGDDERVGGALSGLIGRSATLGLGLASPTSLSEENDNALSASAHSPSSPMLKSPSIANGNTFLAPGTASGVSAGPSTMLDPTSPVDWDLWQSVVYEGPTAVARTSPEELNRAIATGIPNAIRGVVWQVLAQSKNDELESVYRDLVTRGTDKDKDRISSSSISASISQSSASMRERDDVVSSASSVHSDHYTPATTFTNRMRSPSPPKDKDSEAVGKAQVTSMAERKRKAADDATSLQKLEKSIKRDLGARTSYSKFAASAGLQEGLFGVCKAYALFDEGVGYAQGMNFLAMPLLFNMPEEEAFCLLVRLMNQYHLRNLFIQDMPGLHMHLYQFERLLEDFEPGLYCHLHRRQVTPLLYATQWFLTLFAYRFPLQLVLRIYDLILSEGLEAILKFGIVLMQKNATTLLGMNDMVAITAFLKDRLFDVYIDQAPSAGSILESGFFGSSGASIDKEVYRADQLIQDACSVKITPETLKAYTLEWEEKTKIEKDLDAELESLKNLNQSLMQKVRRLEERVQEHDAEHAALATELVRTKVENGELEDENESLRGQVRELRLVVEKQPEEVEERLKSEMERLMKRNQEVHEENTRLEEDMSSMEKELVETKMKYAEETAEHQNLRQRWNDLRKALD